MFIEMNEKVYVGQECAFVGIQSKRKRIIEKKEKEKNVWTNKRKKILRTQTWEDLKWHFDWKWNITLLERDDHDSDVNWIP